MNHLYSPLAQATNPDGVPGGVYPKADTVVLNDNHCAVAHENNLSDICTNHYNIQSPEPGREWKIREVR